MAKECRQRGLTLVELLVGLTAGLVVLLVVTQVMQNFEGQKRTSTGGNDAQTNGAVALYLLEQDIRMAGYGLFGPEHALCPMGINVYHSGGGSGAVVKNAMTFLPIKIKDGGADKPDLITTMRSSAEFGAIPISIVKTMPTPSSIVTANSSGGLQNGDLFIVAARDGGKVCTLMQMSQPPQTTGNGVNLNHNPGESSPYNPPNPENVFTIAPTYDINDVVVGFGNQPSIGKRFSVGCDHLVQSNPTEISDDELELDSESGCTKSSPLVAQIVDLQAQYGVASNSATPMEVDRWEDATGAWANPSAADSKLIRAIRIAVVVRHPYYEREAVAPTPLPDWVGEATVNIVEGSPNYRHRVFATVIPLRNVIWAP